MADHHKHALSLWVAMLVVVRVVVARLAMLVVVRVVLVALVMRATVMVLMWPEGP